MDQQALDDAYDQEIWAPNRALIVEQRKAASERARAILGMPKRVAYGSGEPLHAAELCAAIGALPDEAYMRTAAAADLAARSREAEAAAELRRALDFYQRVDAAAYLERARTGTRLAAATRS